MSFFRKIIARTFGTVSEAQIEALAQDQSRTAEDRGRDIARAVDGSAYPQPYFAYRDRQLRHNEQQFEAWKIIHADWKDIHARIDRLRELNIHHTRNVKEMAKAGDDNLLENAHKLEGAETELRRQWHQMQMMLQSAKSLTDKATDTFTTLCAAEKHMATLPQSEKNFCAEVLGMVHDRAAYLQQLVKTMPPESRDLEKAVANARNNITAREKAAREATLAAEANNLKIKFNEYLQTGLATDAAVVAPKTARFTRKPKPVSA